MKYAKNIMIYLIIVLAVMTLFQFLSGNNSTVDELTTSEFNAMVQDGELASVNIVANENAWEIEAKGNDDKVYTATIPPSEDLVKTLDEANVDVRYQENQGHPWWMNLFNKL